ncbi:MAG TPA: enoyl-CoA hydratase/isomerase family protein [Bacteroidales bacterium]|nr:enoyl-CoA hydratase/isomerase family protein [Bacteroidales bacterium]
MSQSANILIEKKGCISVLKINSPPQNYLKSPSFISKELLYNIADDQEIKGIIITGTGRHFSAGADLENLFELVKYPDILKQEMTAGSELLEQISELKIPVIAAINGVCWGGGLEIALSCHIRFASAKALFAFPEINSALLPGLGGIVRMVKESGTFAAIANVLSGEIFDAEKALKLNVVHQLTEENVLEYSLKYLNSLLESKPKKVIVSIMQSIHNAYKLPLHEALHEETLMFCELAEEEAARRKSGSL